MEERKRNFGSFLEAFEAYADDSFVPPQFNTWAGLSIIASALERKVWLPWTDNYAFYPNIFVMLVALPGVGKSVSLNRAVDLIREMNNKSNRMNLIPSQVTEAKFIEVMGNSSSFQIGNKVYQQSAGFYWASEASNSLKNIYGEFTACLTDFYDCPKFWEKATKKDDRTTLRNVCLNLLAGSTFDYLGKLVNEDEIMGGFASRILYVVHREKLVRTQAFQGGLSNQSQARLEFRKKLVDDLHQIHQMVGPFSADPEFGQAWQEWYPKFEERRQNTPSEKLQSLLARTNPNILKVSMLLSAAESDDRVLKIHHWNRARDLVENVGLEIPQIFRIAKAGDTKSQGGLTQAIVLALEPGPLTKTALRAKLFTSGFTPAQIDQTIDYMLTNGLMRNSGFQGSKITVELTEDAKGNF